MEADSAAAAKRGAEDSPSTPPDAKKVAPGSTEAPTELALSVAPNDAPEGSDLQAVLTAFKAKS